MYVICKAGDSHDPKMISLKQDNSEWYETFYTNYHLKWNEIKQLLSACTSMLKFTKLLGRGTPGIPTSTCMLYFSESMLCLKLYWDIFIYIWVYIYLHVCISGRECIHLCTNIHHNFAFSPIHGLSHSLLFFLSILFFFRIPSFLKCIKDETSSYSTSRARRWSLVKLCRLGRPMTAAFALMGFPSTAANIVFLLITGNYCYIYFLVVILFDWHSRMSYCHIVMPVIAWVVCLLLLLKIKDCWFLIPDEMTYRFNHVQCQPEILGHILTTLDVSRFNLELYLIRLDKEKYKNTCHILNSREAPLMSHPYGRAMRMDAFSAFPALCAGNSPVIGEFPSQRPVTRCSDVFFDLHLNKRLRKQSRRR